MHAYVSQVYALYQSACTGTGYSVYASDIPCLRYTVALSSFLMTLQYSMPSLQADNRYTPSQECMLYMDDLVMQYLQMVTSSKSPVSFGPFSWAIMHARTAGQQDYDFRLAGQHYCYMQCYFCPHYDNKPEQYGWYNGSP